MKIETIKLRGFIGIKKGLGLDEISLDLSSLYGLIALSGPNGRGKSTILENLQPFRSLASRKKALQHHVCLRDSFRDLSFAFNGSHYRTLVKIDSSSEKQEGFIWRDGEPQVNGKAREYDRYIEELFGTPALFFNSVFCAQGSDKIADMTPGQLKGLFAEFLRLDRLIAYEQTSKQIGQILAGQVAAVDRELDYMRRIVEATEGIEKDIERKRREHAAATEALESYKVEIARHETALKEAVEKVNKNKAIEAQLTTERKALSSARDDLTALEMDSKEDLGKYREEAKALNADIAGYEKTLEEAPAIRRAVASVAKHTSEIEATQALIDDTTKRKDALQPLIEAQRAAKEKARATIESLKNDKELAVLYSQLESLSETSAVEELKDPECQSTKCSFIARALEAKKQIPLKQEEFGLRKITVQTQTEGALRAKEAAEEKLHGLRKQEEALLNSLKTMRGKISFAQSEITALKPTAAKAPQIAIGEARMETTKARLGVVVADGISIKTAWDKRLLGKQEEIAEREKLIAEAKKLIDQNADARVREINQDLETTSRHIATTQEAILEISKSIAAMEAKIQEAEKHKAQMQVLDVRRQGIMKDVGEWQYLQTACSANGLRALEIDSVAPGISSYANGLLAEAFGPLFTVRFRTQDEETGREILEIPVMRDDGTEPLLENLSGGEKVWVLKALRLAMTLISKEKSGRNFLTAMADEEDGALDVENAQNFVRLYRAFMTAGGFEACLFISHKPESIAMADHVISFGEKGVSVE